MKVILYNYFSKHVPFTASDGYLNPKYRIFFDVLLFKNLKMLFRKTLLSMLFDDSK